jgi:hypothetical protein
MLGIKPFSYYFIQDSSFSFEVVHSNVLFLGETGTNINIYCYKSHSIGSGTFPPVKILLIAVLKNKNKNKCLIFFFQLCKYQRETTECVN